MNEDLGGALFGGDTFTIYEVVEVVKYREEKGWLPNGVEFGYLENGEPFIEVTFVNKHSLPSVLGSGVHADAWQGTVTMSEGPSDDAVKRLAYEESVRNGTRSNGFECPCGRCEFLSRSVTKAPCKGCINNGSATKWTNFRLAKDEEVPNE